MERNAKQFRDGKSQVNPDNWDLLLAMIAKTEMPHDFLTAEERRQEVVDRDPFSERSQFTLPITRLSADKVRIPSDSPRRRPSE